MTLLRQQQQSPTCTQSNVSRRCPREAWACGRKQVTHTHSHSYDPPKECVWPRFPVIITNSQSFNSFMEFIIYLAATNENAKEKKNKLKSLIFSYFYDTSE